MLTDSGRRASEAYRSATDDIIAETFAGWSSADLRVLAGLLERVAEDFTRPVAERKALRTRAQAR
jgi:DNA-binding MarR family transcriptional regulator